MSATLTTITVFVDMTPNTSTFSDDIDASDWRSGSTPCRRSSSRRCSRCSTSPTGRTIFDETASHPAVYPASQPSQDHETTPARAGLLWDHDTPRDSTANRHVIRYRTLSQRKPPPPPLIAPLSLQLDAFALSAALNVLLCSSTLISPTHTSMMIAHSSPVILAGVYR